MRSIGSFLIGTLAVGLAWSPAHAQPESARTVAAIDQTANAADAYRRVSADAYAREGVYERINECWHRQMGTERWWRPDEASRQLLVDECAMLRAIIDATQIERCAWATDWSQGMATEIEDLGLARAGLRLLMLDALRLLETEPHLATQRLLDAIRLGEHYGESEALIADEVAFAVVSVVYNVCAEPEVGDQLRDSDRAVLLDRLDTIAARGFPRLRESAQMGATLWTMEIDYFLETGKTRVPEDVDESAIELFESLFEDRRRSSIERDARLFAPAWREVIEAWDDPDRRDSAIEGINPWTHGGFAVAWVATVKRALEAEDRFWSRAADWREVLATPPHAESGLSDDRSDP